jgi:hypothetical protein
MWERGCSNLKIDWRHNAKVPFSFFFFENDHHPVRLSYSAESAAIQQCFSLITNQRTVLSATINQRNEQTAYQLKKL